MELDINLENVRRVLEVYEKEIQPTRKRDPETVLDDLERENYCEYADGSKFIGTNPKLFLTYYPHTAKGKFEAHFIPNICHVLEKDLISLGEKLKEKFEKGLEKEFS